MPRICDGRRWSSGKKNPVTLVKTVVARKSAVQPSSRSEPSMLDRLIEPVEIGEISGVTLHAGDILADFPHSRVQLSLAAASDKDVSTLFDEQLGGRPIPEVAPGITAIFPSSFWAMSVVLKLPALPHRVELSAKY